MRVLTLFFLILTSSSCLAFESDPVLHFYATGELDHIAYRRRNFYVIDCSAECSEHFPKKNRANMSFYRALVHKKHGRVLDIVSMAQKIGWKITHERLSELTNQDHRHLNRYLKGLIAIEIQTALDISA